MGTYYIDNETTLYIYVHREILVHLGLLELLVVQDHRDHPEYRERKESQEIEENL